MSPSTSGFRVAAGEIPNHGLHRDLTADTALRRDLARRLDLRGVEALSARVDLRPAPGNLIAVTGTLRAQVVQTCVVTLEPLPASVEVSFERYFTEDPQDLPVEEEILADEMDPPDPVVDGVIDLADLLAEEISLNLDPFPRRPGTSLDEAAGDLLDRAPAAPENPFAALSALKDKRT